MRNATLWATAWAGIAVGVVATLVGTLTGFELGSLLAGYGVICALASAYLLAGLAIRERVRHASSARARTSEPASLLGRRVF